MVDDGSGTAEGTESPLPFTIVDVSRNLSSGNVIDAGSGTAEGTRSSPFTVDVTANLDSGVTIEDGSGAAEGTVSLSSVEVAGNL